jgi:hypothetical protein
VLMASEEPKPDPRHFAELSIAADAIGPGRFGRNHATGRHISRKSILELLSLAFSNDPQGERNDMHPVEHAENLRNLLKGAEGGAILCTIMSMSLSKDTSCIMIRHLFVVRLGGTSNLSFNRNTASMLNRIYSRFLLERVEKARSDLHTPELSIKERMRNALFKLAGIVDRQDRTSKDPLSPMSFSCLSEADVTRQAELLREYENSDDSFSPLGPDGRPLRK